ncbi:DUF3164 family protein [Fusobacterium varium]|uniref:DUF3164 family protein n=1 Tax=Fusobacterium varium TaxID=856 RepID=UPI000E4BC2E1|nr:DUF3164 family protein [Fusobacterium varium]RHG37447.1 DUF3164 family protein [Fusobacterium varium]
MVDIKKMTQEEKKAMLAALQEEENEVTKKRNEYKELVKETVIKNFEEIKKISELLMKTKKNVFEDFATILEMKAELYGIKENQQTHTFTTDEGLTIKIGHRVVDDFDDTVHTGIEKVKGYIKSLALGDRKIEIERMLELLLKKDKKGNLRANRVLELKKLALEVKDEEFIDGVKIIEQAYTPQKSSEFIEAYYKNDKGEKIYIPLSISSASLESEKNDI